MLRWLFKKKKVAAAVEEKQKEVSSEFSTGLFDVLDKSTEEEGKTAEEIKRAYISENAIQRVAPKPTTPEGVAMDSCDAKSAQYQANYDNANPHLLAYYIASSSFIGYYACAIIAQHWLVSKGCELKARDAVKKWYDISVNDETELDPEQIKFIEKLDKKYKLRANMVQGVKFRNVFGIRHILFKHKDPDFDYEKPFNPDSFAGGKYAGMSQIDPYWITPEFSNEDLSDPSALGFYEPTFWLVNGVRYHKSHFVILMGDEVADYLKPTYRYGGVPLTQKVYERVYASERTANEAPQLVMTKRLNVRKVNIEKAQANKAKLEKNLRLANEMRDNYGTQVIDTTEEISQLETALADLDNVIMTQYQLVCSEFGIPATKLLGVSPKGFSSGEGESDNYIEDVEELQGNDMTDIANAHHIRLVASELKEKFKVDSLEIDLDWRPIKVISELDKSTIRVNNTTADKNLYDIGAIDSLDPRERIIKDKNSGYTGIAMPEVVEDPELEPEEESNETLNDGETDN